MRLTLFNGSPRGKQGNTTVMLRHFVAGLESGGEQHSHTLFYLHHLQEADRFAQGYAEAEMVLLAFPLYTDAMPGIVKAFIETLSPYCGRPGNPALGFLVQSGFPEATHSRHVERYLEKLALRLGGPYLGTIIKGGGEGARFMPDNARMFTLLRQLGQHFGETGQLEATLLAALAKPERYAAWMAPLFTVMLKSPLGTMYWNRQLKENGVYAQRFARPYEDI